MCGRFTYKFTWAEIHDQLEAFIGGFDDIGEGVVDHPPRFNIAPTQPIVVIWQDAGRKKASLMRWGLVPSWVKDPREFSLIINARVETVLEKPSFRGSMQHHRCLIPANGFYEWRTGSDGTKQPFYITTASGEPMVFAGVYSNWMGPSGEEVDTTAIITVPSNPDVRPIHDRMPAIMPKEMMADWLNTAEVKAKDAHAMLRSAPEGVVLTYPVTKRVNSNRNEGEDLIAPIKLDRSKEPAKAPPPKRASQGELF